jgi:hypothetical protein
VVDEASTDERLTPMLDASMVRIVKSKAVTHARTGQRRRCGLEEAEYKDGFGLMVLVYTTDADGVDWGRENSA